MYILVLEILILAVSLGVALCQGKLISNAKREDWKIQIENFAIVIISR